MHDQSLASCRSTDLFPFCFYSYMDFDSSRCTFIHSVGDHLITFFLQKIVNLFVETGMSVTTQRTPLHQQPLYIDASSSTTDMIPSLTMILTYQLRIFQKRLFQSITSDISDSPLSSPCQKHCQLRKINELSRRTNTSDEEKALFRLLMKSVALFILQTQPKNWGVHSHMSRILLKNTKHSSVI